MKVLLYSFGLVTLWIGCTTAPDFERNNPNDPESSNFSPTPPENSVVSIEISDSRYMIFSWNKKNLQDGVFISKRYSVDDAFVPLDTLFGLVDAPAQYIDSSGVFTIGTALRFKFFRVLSDSSIVASTGYFELALDFEPVIFQTRFTEGRAPNISIFWEYRPRSNVRIRYFDGIDVEVNRSSNIDSENWELLHTYKNETNTGYSINLYDIRVRIRQFLLDSSGVKLTLKEKNERFYSNSSEELEYFYRNNSDTILIRWRDGSYFFADGYVISSTQSDTVERIFDSYLDGYNLNLPQEVLPLNVSVQPFIKDNFGEILSITIPKRPE